MLSLKESAPRRASRQVKKVHVYTKSLYNEGLMLLLVLRHGAKSSLEGHPRIALGCFTLEALLLYPPHAIVMRLHGRDSYVVILILETADLLSL